MNKSLISLSIASSILLTALTPAIAANNATNAGAAKKLTAQKQQQQTQKAVAQKPQEQKQVAAKQSESAKQIAARANKLFSQGVDFADKKFYNEAIAKFQEAVKLDSSKPGYFNELAVALLTRNQGDDEKQAIDALRKAAEAAPKHSAYWVNLGSALNRTHDAAGAEEAYRKALALTPNDWQAHQNLAVALYSQKKMTEARDEFNAAIANNAPIIYKEIADKAIKDIDSFLARREKEAISLKEGKGPSAEANKIEADLHIVMPTEKKENAEPPSNQPAAQAAPTPGQNQNKIPAESKNTDATPTQTGSGNPEPKAFISAPTVPPGL